MPEIEINTSTVNSVMRIEICLPRVFPWKLRGGDRPRHGGYHKVHHPHWRRIMKRSVVLIITILGFWVIAPNAISQTVDESRLSGRRADATVSFGLWQTDPS